mmetsp:Transcript_26143/g.61412  ORF Transcript_26143/g.61412 Transcript_26143/m.61412 type:complete len:125 (-) Transcript_26143:1233-1607(-)
MLFLVSEVSELFASDHFFQYENIIGGIPVVFGSRLAHDSNRHQVELKNQREGTVNAIFFFFECFDFTKSNRDESEKNVLKKSFEFVEFSKTERCLQLLPLLLITVNPCRQNNGLNASRIGQSIR